MIYSSAIKRAILRRSPRLISNLIRRYYGTKPLGCFNCNICGYYGQFDGWYTPYISDSRCPDCGSIERTRLFHFALTRFRHLFNPQTLVLHFAPERALRGFFSNCRYVTADAFHPADRKLDIESIDFPDNSVDIVIANHVLEHVDDLLAARELLRILEPGGHFFCMVPIVEGWDTTYENSAITATLDRKLHFGQEDHLRMYGKDFTQRMLSVGFILKEGYTVFGEDAVKYRLNFGEKVFVFVKP